MAGAGFTTFAADLGGCKNGNAINCSSYLDKDYVYMNGGPAQSASGLADGSYYFTLLVPGSQLTGFLQGDPGNLSDVDAIDNRTFTVAGHEITAYAGTHEVASAPNGRTIIGLAPFDDTTNPGGVYILAICQSGASSPSQCKYDAFRIKDTGGNPEPQFPVASGGKYYDGNTNGRWDTGEAGIAAWPIDYTDEVAGTAVTDGDGHFSVTLIADTYAFAERLPANGAVWHQTGNTEDQTSTTGDAIAALLADMTYAVSVTDDSTVDGLYFGNVCVGAGGGHTLGFWSNKNGQALIDEGDLAALRALHLYTWPSSDFDPAKASQVRTWLLNATATNMAIMLSAQRAAMELNIRNGFVNEYALVYAPETTGANAAGFVTLHALVDEADASLAAYPWVLADRPERAHQEALKNAFDAANNNLSFVQASPATCAAPVF